MEYEINKEKSWKRKEHIKERKKDRRKKEKKVELVLIEITENILGQQLQACIIFGGTKLESMHFPA